LLYHIDMTFHNGGVACFGLETGADDMKIIKFAPIARRTINQLGNSRLDVVAHYLRRGAKIQKLTSEGWIQLWISQN
jgi:hypothetical protein